MMDSILEQKWNFMVMFDGLNSIVRIVTSLSMDEWYLKPRVAVVRPVSARVVTML